MQRTVLKQEWWWVLIVSHAIFLFSSLPFVAGYAAQTSDRDFAGGFHSRGDYAVYIAMMHYGQQGHWDYHLRFTSERHNGIYTRLFYVAAGNLSRWTSLNIITVFHLARWLLGIAVCLSLYFLVSQIFPEIIWRRYTFLLAATAAGAGWLQAILAPWSRPLDILFADGYVFFGLATFPHYSATTAAILLSISLFILYLKQPRIRYLIGIILLGIFTQFINPIAYVLADFAMAGTLIGFMWNQKRPAHRALIGLLVIGLTQFPQLFINIHSLALDPFWAQFTAQNSIPTPPISGLLWGYGLLWLILPAGVFAVLKLKNWLTLGLLLWLVGALILAYSPLAIQLRFLHGFVIPLSVLGAFGLKETLFPYLQKKGSRWLSARRNLIPFMLLLLSMITSIKVSLGDALFLYNNVDSEFYEPHSLTLALDWLNNNSGPDDMILATEQTSQWAAIRIGRPVYLGHLFETLHYQAKGARVGDFYNDKLPPEWLTQNKIHWVIYGPHEKEVSASFQPINSMQLVYENKAVKIYEVISH